MFFTITTGLVQLRLLPRSIQEMWGGRSAEGNSLTPFQAFATGLASRVGVGNIGGVATAIALGGPGAVFWMWVTALMGMSSAFAESSLAQLYKTRDPNGMFRGGPAYYITRGLKFKPMAIAFAVTLISHSASLLMPYNLTPLWLQQVKLGNGTDNMSALC
ncbi:transporter [Actinobacillus equuli]|nr:transporter [Actinobacillus equuli]